MRKKGKRKKSAGAWAVVFLIFANFGIWLVYIHQPFAGIILILTSLVFLRRALNS